jgi:hypothetical protein
MFIVRAYYIPIWINPCKSFKDTFPYPRNSLMLKTRNLEELFSLLEEMTQSKTNYPKVAPPLIMQRFGKYSMRGFVFTASETQDGVIDVFGAGWLAKELYKDAGIDCAIEVE